MKGLNTLLAATFALGLSGCSEEPENVSLSDVPKPCLDYEIINELGRERIKKTLVLFKCKDGLLQLEAKPSELVNIDNFDGVSWSGDCSKFIEERKVRIRRVIDRLDCGEDGKPYESLTGREVAGGRIGTRRAGGLY